MRLMIGTSESIAKDSLRNGISGPVILTNSYLGFFCRNYSRFGIITINFDKLLKNFLAPYAYRGRLLFNNKGTNVSWEKSIEVCGTCVYFSDIKPNMISKIVIFDPTKNKGVAELLSKQEDPCKYSYKVHKQNYKINSNLCNWLNGENIGAGHILNAKCNYKDYVELSNMLQNRESLNLYYMD